MRKLIYSLLLVGTVALGQAPTYTPNYGFQIPGYGTSNWQVPMNYNFTRLDQILSGNAIGTTGLSTWTSTVTYTVGELVLYNGQGYISLQNGNTGQNPASQPTWWTNNLASGGGGGGNISGSLTVNAIPIATTASTISNSCLNQYQATVNGTTATQVHDTCPNGLLVDGPLGVAGTFYPNGGIIMGGGITAGNILISGVGQFGQLQNNVPGSPIVISQSGGGALALDIFGGLNLRGPMSLSTNPASPNYGTAGQCFTSNGPGSIPVWGTCGGSGGGGATLPASGVVYATSTTTSTAATSPQLVTALNTSPSTTLSASLIPTLNQSTTGTASNLSGTPALPNGTTATTQSVGDNSTKIATTAFVQANAGSGSGSSPIFVHNLSGANPTAIVNSSTVPALDSEYLVLSANNTGIQLPGSGIADGEVLTFIISQPMTGSAFTLASSTANSPFGVGFGSNVVNAVPGGCPNIGSTVASIPSQLLISVIYKATPSIYEIVGCQTAPAQLGVTEATLGGGSASYGNYGNGTMIGSTKVTNAGHFTNLQIVNTSAAGCTTGPTVNVHDYTASTQGVAVVGASVGNVGGTGAATVNQAETLPFSAGDQIVITVDTTGVSCGAFYVVSAQYVEP